MISEALQREIIKQLRGRGKKVNTMIFEHILDMRNDLIDLNEQDLTDHECFVVSLLQEIVQTFSEELLIDIKINREEEE